MLMLGTIFSQLHLTLRSLSKILYNISPSAQDIFLYPLGLQDF